MEREVGAVRELERIRRLEGKGREQGTDWLRLGG